jgi:hypothetical protein
MMSVRILAFMDRMTLSEPAGPLGLGRRDAGGLFGER